MIHLRRAGAALLLFALPPLAPLRAQALALPDSALRTPGAPIRWWHAAAVVGAAGFSVLVLDQPIREGVQSMRGSGTDGAADVFRQFGYAPVYLGVPAVVTGIGLISGNDRLARAGGRMLASVALAAGATQGIKRVVGRRRPFAEEGAQAFDLLAFDDAALPSGHTTGAFALAASTALELRSPLAGVLLYTAATGTAWSRLNDEQHWLGDVLLGSAIGITSAHLVNGRWRLFHLRPPQILATPTGGTGVGYALTF